MELCGDYRRGKNRATECVILLGDGEYNSIQFLQEAFKIFKKVLNRVFRMTEVQNKNLKWLGEIYMRNERGQKESFPVLCVVVPTSGWSCGLIRWTGPSRYWSRLQTIANNQGYDLEEDGMYIHNTNSTASSKRLQHRNEYDVFEDLGVQYLPPFQRV